VLKGVEVDVYSLDRLRTTVEPSKIDTVCLMISEIEHGLLANRRLTFCDVFFLLVEWVVNYVPEVAGRRHV